MGTIKADRLQPYLYVRVQQFPHGSRPRPGRSRGSYRTRLQGLSALQDLIKPTRVQVPLPTRVLHLALSRAEALYSDLLHAINTDVPRIKIELVRTCISTITLCNFSSRGGAYIECLLVTSLQHNKADSSSSIRTTSVLDASHIIDD
jgi:hypothetical protein